MNKRHRYSYKKGKSPEHADTLTVLRSHWPTKAQRKARSTSAPKPSRLKVERRAARTIDRAARHKLGFSHPRATPSGKPTVWLQTIQAEAATKRYKRLVRLGRVAP